MEKQYRIKKNEEFKNLYKRAKRHYNRDFIIFSAKNNFDYPRFGFTITKKFGKANKRNKARRKLKEIIRKNLTSFESGKDYIITPKFHLIDMDFNEIEKSLKHVAHLTKRKK